MVDSGTFQFWRVRERGGMELLQSSFQDPAYPRHMHATYTIDVVDFGTVMRQGKGRANASTNPYQVRLPK